MEIQTFQTKNAFRKLLSSKTKFQLVRLSMLGGMLVLALVVGSALSLSPKPETVSELLVNYNKLGLASVKQLNQLQTSPQFISKNAYMANLLQENKGKSKIASAMPTYVIEDLQAGAIYKVSTDSEELLADLAKFPVVVEPNFVFSAQAQAQTKVTKSTNLTVNYSKIQSFLKAPWQYRKFVKNSPESQTVVALVDSGMALSEPGNCLDRTYLNLAELDGKANIDDDQNGYVDDICGWNYLSGTNLVGDLNGHGTHLGGLILAFSPAAVLPLQVLDADNQVTLDRLLLALDYATNELNSGDIINLSIGSEVDSAILQSAIARATAKGLTVVASAGNLGAKTVLYPAAYPNVIAVSAVNDKGQKAYYANYGSEVDFSLYGEALSFRPDAKQLVVKEGTSQAAALFSGVLATVASSEGAKVNADLIAKIAENGLVQEDYPLGHILDWQSLAKLLWAKPKSKSIN